MSCQRRSDCTGRTCPHLAACCHDQHVTWVVVPQLVSLDELSWVDGGPGRQTDTRSVCWSGSLEPLSTHTQPSTHSGHRHLPRMCGWLGPDSDKQRYIYKQPNKPVNG